MQETEIILLLVVALYTALLFGFIAGIARLDYKRQYFFQNQISTAKDEAQDMTLKFVSQEIHDNINQSLFLTKLFIDKLVLENGSTNATDREKADQFLTKAMDDLRDLLEGLHVDQMPVEGFRKAIDIQVEQLKEAGQYKISFQVLGSYHHLEEQKAMLLYRIFQEAINNIIRHAQARNINIVLDCTSSKVLTLRIGDDGKGFPVTNSPVSAREDRHNLGISHMILRARLIGANIQIESHPKDGTLITIAVPLNSIYDSSQS